MSAASQAAADRYARREAEREERKYQVDCVGTSPYQRKVQAERKAQQDMRKSETFPPYTFNEPQHGPDDDKEIEGHD